LEYGGLSEVWNKLSLNKNSYPSQVLIGEGKIYATFEDGMLREFDFFGYHQDIGFPSGRIQLHHQVYYVENGVINEVPCSGNFIISDENNIFTCLDFLDADVIRKYQNNILAAKSKLFPRIQNLYSYKENLLVQLSDGFVLLDKDLNESATLSIPFLVEVVLRENKILAMAVNQNRTTLFCYENDKLLWNSELFGECSKLSVSDNHYFCLMPDALVCLGQAGKEKWQKEPVDAMASFTDETEHIIVARDKILTIYEVETQIMTWQEGMEYPVCGEIGIGNSGFAVTTYNDGGIHYFGGYRLWEPNF